MMNKETYLEDTLAFVRYIHNDDTKSLSEKYFAIVGTLGHDINGILNEGRCFSPRVSGYSKLAH